MAKQKKLIPCRVCGKMFEPCSYCQSHSDVFRWRNFACSPTCAKQYIASTEAYREAQREKAKYSENKESDDVAPKKRGRKKADPVVEESMEDTEIIEDAGAYENMEVVEDAPTIDDGNAYYAEPMMGFGEDTDGVVDNEIATDTEIKEE